jgi:hypothetical protein
MEHGLDFASVIDKMIRHIYSYNKYLYSSPTLHQYVHTTCRTTCILLLSCVDLERSTPANLPHRSSADPHQVAPTNFPIPSTIHNPPHHSQTYHDHPFHLHMYYCFSSHSTNTATAVLNRCHHILDCTCTGLCFCVWLRNTFFCILKKLFGVETSSIKLQAEWMGSI